MTSKVIDKKGMDAIFSGVGTPKSGVSTPESGLEKSTEYVVTSRESGVTSQESGIDASVLAKAIKQGHENPRISSWNPMVMSVLRYRNLTTPAYSMSKEISELLENAIREKYPELSAQIEKALSNKE